MSDTQRWQRVMDVFEEAADCALSERAALLDAACADDAELRREVEALLVHDSKAGATFLQPPEPPTGLRELIDDPAEKRIGTTVAGYRLVEVIGTGGMGTVYRARQEHLDRDVAVKIIRPGLANPGTLKRFEHEARYLARLRHPNIAQIFEAGTFADPVTGATIPYFVMELVEHPQPITRYCGAGAAPGIRTPDGSPGPVRLGHVRSLDCSSPSDDAGRPQPPTSVGGSEPLPLRERLELFLQVCDAVHHGHQRGLIHRDLKPGNILVGEHGRVKVIDFGVARSTDADMAVTTMQTDSGQLVGTLQYMSPEQCAADVADLDVRSDVYALGVVMYELVCGRPPYDLTGATVYTAARMVCEQAPHPPRQLDARIPRDVDAILRKCLEKDRTRRYQSAAQLGDDIKRHLAGETITARPPSTYRRMIRWASRHAIAATALACTVIVSATAVSTAIGLYYASERPNSLWISDDRREVQMMTIAQIRVGRTLRGNSPNSLLALPDFIPHSGKRLAIIGIGRSDSDEPGPGLFAFDVDIGLNSTGVSWRRSIRELDIPPPPPGRSYPPENFNIIDVRLLEDFLKPGRSVLLTVWAHQIHSWRALVIYDLDGNPIYRLWHDGTIARGHTQWLPDVGLLIVVGTYCTHDAWIINRQLPKGMYAVPVVFAVRPRLGQLDTKLIAVPERPEWYDSSRGRDTAHGPRPMPEWYKFVWPLDRRYAVLPTESLKSTSVPLMPAMQAHVSMNILDASRKALGGVFWTIDESGESLSISKGGDTYNQTREVDGVPLPPSDQFRLVTLEQLLADPFGEIAYGTAADQEDTP